MKFLWAILIAFWMCVPAEAQTCSQNETRGRVSGNGKVRVYTPSNTTVSNFDQQLANILAEGTWRQFGPRTDAKFTVVCDVPPPTTPSPPPPPPPPPPALVIACPSNTMAQAPDANGVPVIFPAPTTSGGVPPIQLSTSPMSGALFSIGTTTVMGSARDTAGSLATCTFTVTVAAPVPPPTTPPPPSNVPLIFSSNFQAALGCNNTALTDGGLWNDGWGGSNACTADIAEVVNEPEGRMKVKFRPHLSGGVPVADSNGPDYRVQRSFGSNLPSVYVRFEQAHSTNWVWDSADHKLAILGSGTPFSQDVYFNVRGNGRGPCGRPVIYVVHQDTMFSDASVQICAGQKNVYELKIVSGQRIEAKVNGRLLTLTREAGTATTPTASNTGIGYIKLDTTYNRYSYPSSLGLTMFTWYGRVAVSTQGWIGQ